MRSGTTSGVYAGSSLLIGGGVGAGAGGRGGGGGAGSGGLAARMGQAARYTEIMLGRIVRALTCEASVPPVDTLRKVGTPRGKGGMRGNGQKQRNSQSSDCAREHNARCLYVTRFPGPVGGPCMPLPPSSLQHGMEASGSAGGRRPRMGVGGDGGRSAGTRENGVVTDAFARGSCVPWSLPCTDAPCAYAPLRALPAARSERAPGKREETQRSLEVAVKGSWTLWEFGER